MNNILIRYMIYIYKNFKYLPRNMQSDLLDTLEDWKYFCKYSKNEKGV